jgi:hypothetical protein
MEIGLGDPANGSFLLSVVDPSADTLAPFHHLPPPVNWLKPLLL